MKTPAGRPLLFLTALATPAQVYAPWFAALKKIGYSVRVVPNTLVPLEPVTVFTDHFLRLSKRYGEMDVLAMSYGGNAALNAAARSETLCSKVGKMVVVCATPLGYSEPVQKLHRLLPPPMADVVAEMAPEREIPRGIARWANQPKLPFDLHCIYHERDWIAPFPSATLYGRGTPCRLNFAPGAFGPFVHQAACVHPQTFRTVTRIFSG